MNATMNSIKQELEKDVSYGWSNSVGEMETKAGPYDLHNHAVSAGGTLHTYK